MIGPGVCSRVAVGVCGGDEAAATPACDAHVMWLVNFNKSHVTQIADRCGANQAIRDTPAHLVLGPTTHSTLYILLSLSSTALCLQHRHIATLNEHQFQHCYRPRSSYRALGSGIHLAALVKAQVTTLIQPRIGSRLVATRSAVQIQLAIGCAARWTNEVRL